MLRRILFAHGGMSSLNEALAHLLKIAGAFDSDVILFHDYALLSSSHIEYKNFEDLSIKELENSMKSRAIEELEALGVELKQYNIPFRIVVARGHAGQLIMETAHKYRVDLIIMGSRGLDEIDSFVLGSTSQYVLHNTNLPVLIIPGKYEVGSQL